MVRAAKNAKNIKVSCKRRRRRKRRRVMLALMMMMMMIMAGLLRHQPPGTTPITTRLGKAVFPCGC